MTDLRITVRNTSDSGGTALTPFWFGFHDGSFDLYNRNEVASAGLEALAEDGNVAPLGAELLADDADAQGFVVAGAAGPIDTEEVTSAIVTVDGSSNGSVSFGAMVLPSNDAFVGTGAAIALFDASGAFTGATTVTFSGSDVLDAGTEVNTELDAAFLNQTGPDTGVTEGGVVTLHPGFNGSSGNPGGTQNILGGTNAFGNFIDPVVADFTLPGAEIAVVHINTVVTRDGTSGDDNIRGRNDDDIVTGGDGNDAIRTGNGWDVVDAGAGDDQVFGRQGDDQLDGGADNDTVAGGRGNDIVNGGSGNDDVMGGIGDDIVIGGSGDDRLSGNGGEDVFVFVAGDGADEITDFTTGTDTLALSVAGIDDFADLLATATDTGDAVLLDFGTDGAVFLIGQTLSGLDAGDFVFS